MNIFSLALFACLGGLLPSLTQGHGRLTAPIPRYTRINGEQYSTAAQNAPTGNSPLDEAFVCRNTVANPDSEWLEVEAGGVVPMEWELTAKHIGDCFVYISCTPDLPDLEKEWFKIADVPYCRDPSQEDLTQSLADGRTDGSLGGPLSGVPVNIAIPNFLAANDHCILRWEWYALHQVRSVEYYAQCVDIKIMANSAGVPVAEPLPTFTIGDVSFPNLRDPGTDATQNYRQGFVSGNQFLSSDIALVSPGGDGSDLPTPPPPSPVPDGGENNDGDGGDGIINDGGGLCFQPGTPLLDAPIDNQAGTCGTTSRCETGNCCSSNGFCGPPTLGFCENNIADYRTVACSSISNPGQELVQYEDVDNCIQVFCGDILSICTGEANCAAEWATVDERLNNRQNVCGSSLRVDDNFAKYSLQCSCDNCGALISQLAGEENEGLDVAVVAGACVGVLLVGGLVVGGFIYAKKGASPDRTLSSATSTSTELTTTKSSSIFGRKSRGKSWLDGTDAQSVV